MLVFSLLWLGFGRARALGAFASFVAAGRYTSIDLDSALSVGAPSCGQSGSFGHCLFTAALHFLFSCQMDHSECKRRISELEATIELLEIEKKSLALRYSCLESRVDDFLQTLSGFISSRVESTNITGVSNVPVRTISYVEATDPAKYQELVELEDRRAAKDQLLQLPVPSCSEPDRRAVSPLLGFRKYWFHFVPSYFFSPLRAGGLVGF